jgi:general secretion pathway protein B
MSFILDALKKAESERHRASGPVLVDVRIAPPRRSLPAWAWVLGLVLLANLAILGWLMLRKPAAPAAVAVPPAPASSVVATTPPAPQAPIAPPPRAAPTTPAYEPPPAPTPAPMPESVPAAAAVDVGALPTLQQLQAAGVDLPPLLLNLHAYDPTPSQRYVLLNGLRLAEGEFTPDGIKVETITEHGVVLEARGRRFILPAGG